MADCQLSLARVDRLVAGVEVLPSAVMRILEEGCLFANTPWTAATERQPQGLRRYLLCVILVDEYGLRFRTGSAARVLWAFFGLVAKHAGVVAELSLQPLALKQVLGMCFFPPVLLFPWPLLQTPG